MRCVNLQGTDIAYLCFLYQRIETYGLSAKYALERQYRDDLPFP